MQKKECLELAVIQLAAESLFHPESTVIRISKNASISLRSLPIVEMNSEALQKSRKSHRLVGKRLSQFFATNVLVEW